MSSLIRPLLPVLALAGSSPMGVAAQADLVPCDAEFGERALCTNIPVPEDRLSGNGRTIDIHVVVLKAPANISAEPLLLFPGGPGQPTSDLIPLARQVYPAVLERRDVVFIGQRGAGRSNALECIIDVRSQPSRAFGGLWDTERIAECYDDVLSHADPSHYTTATYVADINHVLDVLGYDRVILWGGSGGTRTAVALIRAHSERVVGAVLDGMAPIDYAMPAPFSRFVQESWERVVEDCERQQDCGQAFPDLAADLERALDRLGEGPVATDILGRTGTSHTVGLTRGDFLYALRGALYSAQETAALPKHIHAVAESGDFSPFAQSLYNRSAALLGGGLSTGLHLSVYCSEDVPAISEKHLKETEGTLLGRYLIDQYRAACGSWPVDPAPSSWYRSFESSVPVLFLSGYYDPSTPAAAAEHARKSFPNSRHFVVRSVGHGAGFTCARVAVERYLVSGALDAVENPCPDEPIHFEVR